MNTSCYTTERNGLAVAQSQRKTGSGARNGAFGLNMRGDARGPARVATTIAAMVRTDEGDRLGYVRNLSARGLMLSMTKPLRRGEFIEILTKGHSLVGQVQWVNDCNAGIALRDPAEVDAIIRGENCPVAARPKAVSRRTPKPATATIYANSHVIARQLQFMAILAVGLCSALLIALFVHDLLAEVSNQVGMGLPG